MPEDTSSIDPAPLGLAAFALTNLPLSLVNAGWLPREAGTAVVIPLGIVFGGIIQLITGILSFYDENLFATVAFNSYGAFWLWFGLLELFAMNGLIASSPAVVGVTLIIWGIFSTYLWIGTFKLTWGLWLLFIFVMLTFYFLGFGEWLGIESLIVWGGYFGIALSIVGFYLSFAGITNWCFEHEVLPVGGPPLGETADE